MIRFHFLQQVANAAAFQLKYALGFASLQKFKSGFVVQRYIMQINFLAGGLFDDVCRATENSQVAEAQEIHFQKSNILYKTPNKAAMEALDPGLLEAFPNMAMQPADLIRFEQLRDLGDGQKDFARTVTEIMAAQ